MFKSNDTDVTVSSTNLTNIEMIYSEIRYLVYIDCFYLNNNFRFISSSASDSNNENTPVNLNLIKSKKDKKIRKEWLHQFEWLNENNGVLNYRHCTHK